MTQLNLVEKALKRHTKGPGITPAKISALTKLPVSAVYRNIYDLRAKGTEVYTNVRNVKGKKQTFYRLNAA